MSAQGDPDFFSQKDPDVSGVAPFSSGHDFAPARPYHSGSDPTLSPDGRSGQIWIMEPDMGSINGLLCLSMDEEKIYQL